MKKILLPLFFTGTAIMMVVMMYTGKPLNTTAAPQGILNLEFANTAQKVNAIIDSWVAVTTEDAITAAKQNTYFDFIFLFFYAGFLFLASKKIARQFNNKFGRAGRTIAIIALAAGGLDVLENIGMLQSISGNVSDPMALFTTGASLIKWVSVLVAVLYVLFGFLAWCYGKLFKK